VWQDLKAKEAETPKGNCMTQVFYAKKILPEHIKQVKALEVRYNLKYHFQEDDNSSHGIKSLNSPPAQLKREADLLLLMHPPQSPDINPVEACWNIIKGKLTGRRFKSVALFKAAIQQEWDKITLLQIRKCIREMPARCRKVIAHPNVRIQSGLW
jgi:hypothetical protein